MGYEPGGYADKLGNRFEGRWVVQQMLLVLSGQLSAITLETVGDDERGVDLWMHYHNGKRNGHQCKGELGNKSQWSMADLHRKGVLEHLRFQLERNQDHEFTLVSSVHARSLLDLCRRARLDWFRQRFLRTPSLIQPRDKERVSRILWIS